MVSKQVDLAELFFHGAEEDGDKNGSGGKKFDGVESSFGGSAGMHQQEDAWRWNSETMMQDILGRLEALQPRGWGVKNRDDKQGS